MQIIILYKLYIIMTFNILRNKYVLYFLLFISMTNVLGYLTLHDYESLTLMVSIGMLSYYFSKNMTIILSAAILGTALLRVPVRKEWPWREQEGMANPSTEEEEEEEEGDKEEDGIKLLDTMDKEMMTNTGVKEIKALSAVKEETMEEAFAPATDEEESDLEVGKKKVELQYDNLAQIAGKNSGNIMAHQVDLEAQMKNLGPLMKSAENMMEMMKGSGMLSMMEKMGPMLQKII